MEQPRKRILCVDDETDVIFLLKKYFERYYPLDVSVAENGESALKIMAERTFDAVLTDVNMPGMSGLDLTARILDLYPKTIVVVITGSVELESLAAVKGTRFLAKPVSLAEFKRLIFEVFGLLPS